MHLPGPAGGGGAWGQTMEPHEEQVGDSLHNWELLYSRPEKMQSHLEIRLARAASRLWTGA